MSRRSGGLGWGVALWLLAQACGGGTDDAPTSAAGSSGGAAAGSAGAAGGAASTRVVTGKPIAVADLPEAYADAVCRQLGRCCPGGAPSFAPDACDRLAEIVQSELERMLGSAQVVYDAAAAGTCVASLRAAIDACQAPDERASCAGLTRGTVPLGAACMDSAECADAEGASTYCDEDRSGVMSCAVGGSSDPDGVEVGAGEACSATCDLSPYGGWGCRGTTVPVPGPVPHYCVRQRGLRCGEGSTCVALLPLGAPCELFDGECELELRCSGGGMCIARAALGEACLSDGDCALGAACVADLCVATVPIGAPCSTSDRCEGEAECIAGVCDVTDRLDDYCAGDFD